MLLILFKLSILDVWKLNSDNNSIVCGNNSGAVWVDIIKSHGKCEKEKVGGIVICTIYIVLKFEGATTLWMYLGIFLWNIKGVVYPWKQVLKALRAADDLPTKPERKGNHANHNISF